MREVAVALAMFLLTSTSNANALGGFLACAPQQLLPVALHNLAVLVLSQDAAVAHAAAYILGMLAERGATMCWYHHCLEQPVDSSSGSHGQ